MYSRVCCPGEIVRGECNEEKKQKTHHYRAHHYRGTRHYTPILRGWNELLNLSSICRDRGEISVVLRGCLITLITSRHKRTYKAG